MTNGFGKVRKQQRHISTDAIICQNNLLSFRGSARRFDKWYKSRRTVIKRVRERAQARTSGRETDKREGEREEGVQGREIAANIFMLSSNLFREMGR